MSGLVASGAVMVGYLVLNWYAARISALFRRQYRPPDWRQVWLYSALPISIGVFTITTTLNHPTLPPILAIQCLGILLVGLAFALWPGSIAALQPARLAWMVIISAGLLPPLLLLRVIELPSVGTVSQGTALAIAVTTNAAGIVWSAGAGWLSVRIAGQQFSAGELAASAVCTGYLGLSLLHHLFLTPPDFRYITSTANFFALTWEMQLASWAAVAGLAFFIHHIQTLLGGGYQ